MPFSLLGHDLTIGGGGSPVTVAGKNTVGAKLIVLAVTYQGAVGVVPTDNQGNTYVLGAPYQSAGTSNTSALFYCLNPITSASHAFSLAAGTSSLAVSWWSASAPKKDQQNSSASTSPGSITPAAAGALIISTCSTGGGAGLGTTGINAGFTVLEQFPNNGSSFGLSHAYLIQTPAAPVAPTWTVNGGGQASAILSFVDAAQLNATAGLSLSAVANVLVTSNLAAAATIRVSAAGNMAQGFNASATVTISAAASLLAASRFASVAGFTISGSGRLGSPAALLASAPRIHFSTRSKIPSAHLGRVSITLDGADIRARVGSVNVRDILNDAANTCALTIGASNGPPPQVNQRLRIVVENDDNNGLIFAGTLQEVITSYQLLPDQQVYPCNAIDDTARLNYLRPFGAWVNESATTVALALCSTFAPTFDTSRIAVGLPLVTITFDGSETFIGCLARLASMIGGYTKVEDMAVFLFITDEDDVPDDIDGLTMFHNEPSIQVQRDVSQQRTRVYGRGHGENLLGDYTPGETIVPIEDAVMFNPAGGKAVASAIPDGAVSERFAYTGINLGGSGSLIGPGVSPSVGPSVARAAGAGLGNGIYRYALVDITPAGSSLPSPLSAPLTTGSYPSPGGSISIANDTQAYHSSDPTNGWRIGDTVEWYYAYGDESGPTNAGLPSGHVSIVAIQSDPPTTQGVTGEFTPCSMILTFRYSADPNVTRIYVWFRIIGAAGHASVDWRVFNWLTNQIVNRPEAAGPLQTYPYASPNLYSPPLHSGPTNPSFNQATLTNIALGPGPTTARDLYRTAVNGSALKFLVRVTNNTSTGPLVDATPDASLGAAPPAADTSGLQPVVGQVNSGSTSLLTASAGPFSPNGGWVQLPGNQVVRYTGISGNTLTGIPSSGSGAILTTVQYGDPVVAAPALLGVSGLTKALMAGARICILVQRDDLTAQQTYGIIEYLIVDERRAEASLMQLCDADLLRFARPIVTVLYASRDPKTKSGKTVVFNLTAPLIQETLTIQDVSITEVGMYHETLPRYTVSASSVRFSLEDILRQLAAAAEAT